MTTQARELASLVDNSGNVNLKGSISRKSDSLVQNFGADNDVSLTHVHNTGLLLNSTRQLQFGDSGTYINQSADGVLNLTSDTEVEINATTVDINANVDISGNIVLGGTITVGDADTDNMIINANVNSHIIPNTDDTYDLGSSGQQWRNLFINGTVEADAITIGGVTLSETIADTVGAMVSSNTETNIAVTYEDSDNTLDFVIGTLNQDTSGTAALATSITASANNSTDETVYPAFVDGATGTQGIETDTGLTYNPSSGILTGTQFTGAVVGNVTGNASGTAATVTGGTQSSITTAANLVTVGTIGTGVWQGTAINQTYLTGQSGTNTGDQSTVSGNAGTATILATGRTIAMTGDVVWNSGSFNGSGNVTAAATIQTDAVDIAMLSASGTASSSTFLRGDNSWTAISTSLTVGADSGSDDVVTVGTDTLDFVGTSNEIETTVSNNQIQIGLPNDVTISGDLTVSGTTTSVSSTTIEVADPLLHLATTNNAADAVDIGVYGLYDTSGSLDLYGGLFRDASDSGKWNLFKDLQAAPTTTVNKSGTGYATGTLISNLEGNVVGNLTGTASLATSLTVTANNSTDEATYLAFVDGATGTQGIETDTGLTYNPSSGNLTIGGTVDGRDLQTDGTKLDGIESGATADQTNAEIRAAVEAASDSNVFTDADHTKLNGIEASATADQTAAEILTLIKTVDGASSGLDADLLDAQSGAHYRVDIYNAAGSLLN